MVPKREKMVDRQKRTSYIQYFLEMIPVQFEANWLNTVGGDRSNRRFDGRTDGRTD